MATDRFIATNFPELDTALGGGLRRGVVTAMTSDPCTLDDADAMLSWLAASFVDQTVTLDEQRLRRLDKLRRLRGERYVISGRYYAHDDPVLDAARAPGRADVVIMRIESKSKHTKLSLRRVWASVQRFDAAALVLLPGFSSHDGLDSPGGRIGAKINVNPGAGTSHRRLTIHASPGAPPREILMIFGDDGLNAFR